MMTHLPEPVGDQEIMDMFNFADKDRDGRINFAEFLVMITPVKVPDISHPPSRQQYQHNKNNNVEVDILTNMPSMHSRGEVKENGIDKHITMDKTKDDQNCDDKERVNVGEKNAPMNSLDNILDDAKQEGIKITETTTGDHPCCTFNPVETSSLKMTISTTNTTTTTTSSTTTVSNIPVATLVTTA